MRLHPDLLNVVRTHIRWELIITIHKEDPDAVAFSTEIPRGASAINRKEIPMLGPDLMSLLGGEVERGAIGEAELRVKVGGMCDRASEVNADPKGG